MTSGIVTVTAGALRNSHFHLTDIMSMFPADAVGGSNRALAAPQRLHVDFGHGLTASTDIDGEKKFFRERKVQRIFFEQNGVQAGDKLVVERTGPYEFSVRKVI